MCAWAKAGTDTLSGSASSITVSSLTETKFYCILNSIVGISANSDLYIRFNGDTGSNYAFRYNANGGTDGTGVSQTEALWFATVGSTTTPYFTVGYMINISSEEKLFIVNGIKQETAGATTAPNRSECVGKWANTADTVNSITIKTGGSTFDTNTNLSVLGTD